MRGCRGRTRPAERRSGVLARVAFRGRYHDGAAQRVRAVLAAARLSDDLGAPLAGVLERIASAVAADEEADGERQAALAGPRSTARVLAWLPLLGVALGALLGADPVAVMSPAGWARCQSCWVRRCCSSAAGGLPRSSRVRVEPAASDGADRPRDVPSGPLSAGRATEPSVTCSARCPGRSTGKSGRSSLGVRTVRAPSRDARSARDARDARRTLSAGAAFSPWWWTPVPPGSRAPARPKVPVLVPGPMDAVLLLDLIDVAISTGASLPRALAAVGTAVGGRQGDELARGAAALLLGASWQSAWAESALSDVVGALEASWSTGTAPGPALRGRAERLRRDRRTRSRTAAGSLGVQLVLPLGLCFLPAFVLLGLVPMLLSLAGGLFG